MPKKQFALDQRSLPEKFRAALSQISYWPRAVRLIWEAAPRWTLAWSGMLVVQGLLPVASVYLTKLLVDSLVHALSAGGDWQHVRPTLILLALTAVVMLLVEFLQSAIDWVRTAQSELVQDHIKGLVHRQSSNVDLAFYESPEYYDSLDQARSEAGNRPLALLENGGSFLQNSITLLAMSALLITYSVWLPLLLLVSTLPVFYVVLRLDRRYHQWWQNTTADRRWAQYYDTMLTHCDSAAEVRLFALGKHFQSAYQKIRRRLRTERLRQMRQQSFAKLGAGAASLVILALAIAWMAWRATQGAVTLGDLALFYQAFTRGQGLMRSLLGNVGQVLTNSLYLGNLFAFLDLKPGIQDPVEPVPTPVVIKKAIAFRNVTFSYPGSEKPALQDFELEIPAGKIVAIVGANGAGKTTVLKLLCRFYDPQTGRIEIDGTDIRDHSIKELWQRITVLFQFPLNYHATVAESITMGDLAAAQNAEAIEAAARNAGAHDFIMGLPQGYDTLLGKVLANGVQLSGGEWQRIAMARAYFSRAPIVLLDEPTSFMDSWAEADWFQRFRTLTRERTSIVITHRFTIAMRADIIHVMDAGRIIESGSHHQLLLRDGLYAQSWKAQMQASSIEDNQMAGRFYDEDFVLQEAESAKVF